MYRYKDMYLRINDNRQQQKSVPLIVPLIQSVVWVGKLGICVTSSILMVLLSGFWVSGS